MTFIRNLSPIAKGIVGVLGLAILIGGGWFAWWTISPLFLNVSVSEKLPTAATTTAGSAVVLSVLSQGKFIGADEIIHHAEGTAKLVRTNPTEIIVRFEEDFKVSNGPDLYVWLVKPDSDPKTDYVDLGKLKGNIGSQNYVVPTATDLSQYTNVIVWCKAFSVLFGTAKLERPKN